MMHEPLLPHGAAPGPDERNLATGCHLLAFAGMLFPFGSILGPLVLWLVKRNSSHYVDQQGREAVNFNITMTLALLISAALTTVLIGFVLMPLVLVFWVAMAIVAAVQSSGGKAYRYPLTLRLVQ
ncbi:MAG: DUF4870 domain-containing protein [Alcanivorax sp.]|nr:DUF4870 domain-containing protein [Alcanivorax sp.]